MTVISRAWWRDDDMHLPPDGNGPRPFATLVEDLADEQALADRLRRTARRDLDQAVDLSQHFDALRGSRHADRAQARATERATATAAALGIDQQTLVTEVWDRAEELNRGVGL